jgi:hypothetical protein
VFRLVLQPTDAGQAAERAKKSLASLLPPRGNPLSP